MTEAKQKESPAWARPPVFLIGQDYRGNWVVKDLKELRGGFFVDRDAALRFVRPRAVVIVAEVLELNMSHDPPAPARRESAAGLQRQQRIA